mgnify:CR=1 FL=1
MAKSLLNLDVMNQEGGKQSDYEVHPEKPVVKITANGKSVEFAKTTAFRPKSSLHHSEIPNDFSVGIE